MFSPKEESNVVVSACFMDQPGAKRAFVRLTEETSGQMKDATLTTHGKPVRIGQTMRVRWLESIAGRLHGELL